MMTESKKMFNNIMIHLEENHTDINYYFYYLNRMLTDDFILKKINEEDYEKVITEILNFAYTCAMSDGTVSPEEKIELNKIASYKNRTNTPVFRSELLQNINKMSNNLNIDAENRAKQEERFKKSPFYIKPTPQPPKPTDHY